jgi:hypothetical protein
MKKIIVVLSLLSNYTFCTRLSDFLIEFNNLEKNHEIEWLEFRLQEQEKETKLQQQIVTDRINFKNSHVTNFAAYNGQSTTEKDNERYTKTLLENKIKFYENNQTLRKKIIEDQLKLAHQLWLKQEQEIRALSAKVAKILSDPSLLTGHHNKIIWIH